MPPKKGIKEDICNIIMFLYRIPGEFAIGGIILFWLWVTMKGETPAALIFLVFSIILFLLEVISPILAGARLYKRVFGKKK